MDKEAIEKRFAQEYPGKTIISIPKEDPKEMICEADPTSDHRDFSRAVAVIDESVPHKHPNSIERYEVMEGEITLCIAGEEHYLKQGDVRYIHPGFVHSAKGDSSWVSVESVPGWTLNDHILVDLPTSS